ncbi:hypothetical protein QR680_008505 [Steinernema hermaphroditum]|uniref:C-type lectin domain-containing protein n=1 Tax=Steinernema hermaphroditum TaxID=289476 RepID=A0AA39M753_9BILA|nr:hypothetical protein QR680_008505 [Steinernema hermaphroditum]
MGIWKPLLLVPLLWTLAASELFPVYRYTFIRSKIVGPIYSHFNEDNLKECGRAANKNGAIAFTRILNQTGRYCGLIKTFVSMEELSDPFVRYYLRDKRSVTSKQCLSDQTARQILEGLDDYCNEEEDKLCIELRKIKRQCDAVNVLSVDCRCPPHQKIINDNGKYRCSAVITKEDGTEEYCPALHAAWKDRNGEFCCGERREPCCRGDTHCCRREEWMGEDNDGMPFCCPDGTTFRGRHEGEAVCCPPEMDVVEGNRFCCPKGFVYSETFKKCIAAIEFAKKKPQNQKEMMRVCMDLKSLPVKIENEEQNKALGNIRLPLGGIIGLHIPDGQQWSMTSFRWSVDGTQPIFTKWASSEPNNAYGSYAPEIFTLRRPDGFWIDVNYKWTVHHAFCVASKYDSRG